MADTIIAFGVALLIFASSLMAMYVILIDWQARQ